MLVISLVTTSALCAEIVGLADAETIAEENNPELKALRHETAIADENIKNRFRDFFPSVSVSYRQNRTIAPRDFDSSNYSAQVSVSQPVYDGGRTALAHEIAGLDAAIAKEKYKSAKNQLRLKVRSAYLGIQQKSQEAELAKASLENTRVLYDRARVERRQDAITLLDYKEIENEYKRREFNIKKQEASYADAIVDFANLLNLPPGILAEIQKLDLFHLSVKELGLSPEQLLHLAEENKPEIRQARIDLFKSRREYLITKHDYLPTVAITGHYGRTGEAWPPRALDWGVGVNLTFPIGPNTLRTDGQYSRSKGETETGLSQGGELDIYNNPGYKAAHMRNEVQLLRSKARREDLRRSIEARVERFHRELKERAKDLELLDEKLAVSELRIKVEYRRYLNGERTLHEYLEEEIKMQQTRLDLIAKRVEMALAVNQLETELGLDVDYFKLIDFKLLSPNSPSSFQPRTEISPRKKQESK